MVPFGVDHLIFRARSIQEYVIGLVSTSLFYFTNLLADGKHSIYEEVEFAEALALGRLDHEGAVNGETECRRMITEVHQSLSNIRFGDTCMLKLTAVEDQLVSYPALLAFINNAIRIAQASSQIVSREDSGFGSLTKSFFAHHIDIAITDKR